MTPIISYPWTRLTLMVILCSLPQAHAGAWPISVGHGNAALGFSFLKAETVTDGQGQRQKLAIQETGLSTYGETGLLQHLSLNWSWGILKGIASDVIEKVGTTDPELGLTYHLGHQGKWYYSASINTRFPLGPDNSRRIPDFVYPLFSQQAWAWDARPVIGWSQKGWWFQGSAGPRLRTNGLAAQAGYSLAGGTKIAKDFSTMLALSGMVPLATRSAGSPADREKYLGYQLAFGYQIKKAWATGIQFDSMFNLGQGMPLGIRSNLFARYVW